MKWQRAQAIVATICVEPLASRMTHPKVFRFGGMCGSDRVGYVASD